jgi:hypothetical protein
VIVTTFTREKPFKNQEAGNGFKKMEVVSRSSLGHEREREIKENEGAHCGGRHFGELKSFL